MMYTRAAPRVQVIDNPRLYQGHRRLLGKPGLQRLLAGVRHVDSFVHKQVIGDSLFIPGHLVIPSFIPGEVSSSHQWPRCGERFFGRKTPEERFLGRLRDWCLGEGDPHG